MPDQKHKKPSPLRFIIPALLLFFAACLAGVFLLKSAAADYYRQRFLNVSFAVKSQGFAETTAALDNPGGFYCLHGYLLSDDMTEQELDGLLARDIRLDESEGLVLLEINLLRYRDAPLSAHALAQLEQILSAWEAADYRLILRFLYDWDGNATATEPESPAQIQEHMTQAAPAVNRHAASIYTMQGIFVGCWGEMHGSHHMKTESMCALMKHLSKVIDPGIFLAVRTPAQRRTILNSVEPFPDGSGLAARLGLYNDGMLGSEIDLGTYGDVDRQTSAALTDRWLRAQELEYQDALCRRVPNGGEAVIDNPLNDLDAAIEALRTMHVSYLNCKYQLTVLDKWRETPVQTGDAWNGMDGLTYIGRHLSPRYRCAGAGLSAFDYWSDDTAELSLTLENTAFSGSYRPLTCRIRIVSEADGTVVLDQSIGAGGPASQTDSPASSGSAGQADGSADQTGSAAVPADHSAGSSALHTLCNGEQAALTVTLPLRALPDGAYRVYLSCEQTDDGNTLALANDLPHNENGYEISSLSLSRTPTGTPSGRELIKRYLSHLSSEEKP